MLSSKRKAEEFKEDVDSGKLLKFHDIRKKYYPLCDRHFHSCECNDKRTALLAEKMTRLLIANTRRLFKKEGEFFYCVDGVYKVLDDMDDRDKISNKLWRVTEGYMASTENLVKDTVEQYPELASNLIIEVKAQLDMIRNMALTVSERFSERIRELVEGGDDEN